MSEDTWEPVDDSVSDTDIDSDIDTDDGIDTDIDSNADAYLPLNEAGDPDAEIGSGPVDTDLINDRRYMEPFDPDDKEAHRWNTELAAIKDHAVAKGIAGRGEDQSQTGAATEQPPEISNKPPGDDPPGEGDGGDGKEGFSWDDADEAFLEEIQKLGEKEESDMKRDADALKYKWRPKIP